MPLLADTFVPAAGLRGGHAQTLFAAFARRPPRVISVRRRLTTPDDDFVDIDWCDGVPGAPTVLLLHGLEGSSDASYVRECQRLLAGRGWATVALNFRSCSGEPNLQPQAYSSGDTRDVRWLVPQLPRPLAAIGFSLGASVLLNALARDGLAVDAAVAISAPFNLQRSAEAIDAGTGLGPVYQRYYLRPLKQKAQRHAARFPHAFDVERIKRATSLGAFDDAVTARAYGFASALEYYQRCSSGPVLSRITTPTLLISSHDDAIAPASALPADAALNRQLHVLATRHGGHVGFAAGSPLKPHWWAEATAVSWLAEQIQG